MPAPAATALAGRLVDALARLRNRLLASPRFQRWAARFPLTRPIARRQARGAVRPLRRLRLLAGPAGLRRARPVRDAGRAAARRSTGSRRASACRPRRRERLLRAAAALGLVGTRSRRPLRPRRLGAALLGNPGVAAMVEHHALLYADLPIRSRCCAASTAPTRLVALLALCRARRPDDLAGADAVAPIRDLMAASQALSPTRSSTPTRCARHRRLLDVGGGEGAFLSRPSRRRRPTCDLDAVRPARRGRARRGPACERRARRPGRDARRRRFRDPLPRGRRRRLAGAGRARPRRRPRSALLRAVRTRACRRAAPCWSPSRWRHARRRADRRRLFRLLPARDGQRPAAHAPTNSRSMLREAGFAGSSAADTDAPCRSASLAGAR